MPTSDATVRRLRAALNSVTAEFETVLSEEREQVCGTALSVISVLATNDTTLYSSLMGYASYPIAYPHVYYHRRLIGSEPLFLVCCLSPSTVFISFFVQLQLQLSAYTYNFLITYLHVNV